METSVNAKSLKGALGLCKLVVEKRNTMPILANVKLVAGPGKLSVFATNLETSAVLELPAETTCEGKPLTVPFSALARIAAGKGAGAITLKREPGDVLRVTREGMATDLPITEAEDFPTCGVEPVAFPDATIDGAALCEALDAVSYAASSDETRYNLNGVLFEPTDSDPASVRLVATDGHRLALDAIRFAAPLKGAPKGGAIVPLGAVRVLRHLAQRGGPVGIVLAGERGHAVTSDAQVTFRLIQGEYPSYRQVIPRTDALAHTVTGDAESMARSVGAIPWPAAAVTRQVRIGLNGKVEASVSIPDVLTVGAFPIASATYVGDGAECALSGRYLVDALDAMQGETQARFADTLSPWVFTCQGKPERLALVMPMRA